MTESIFKNVFFKMATSKPAYTPEQKEQLCISLLAGDAEKLASLLHAAPGLVTATVTAGGNALNPMQMAAWQCHAALIPVLMAAGMDVDAGTPLPLAFAVREVNGGPCTALILQHSKADINAVDARGKSLIRLACDASNTQGALALIDKGAVDATPLGGITPLMLAFQKNDRSFASELMKRGFAMTDRDDKGRTPLFFAIYNGNADNISLALDSGGDIHATTNNGQNILMEAARCGNASAVRWMLLDKIDINARDNEGRTALHYLALDSASFNTQDMAKTLLEKRAYIDARDYKGSTLEDLLRTSGQKPELLEYIKAAALNRSHAREPLKIEIFHEGTKKAMRPLRATRFKAAL